MFDQLSDRLKNTMRSLSTDTKLTAENIEEAIADVRRSLLEADVSLKVVKLFISRIRQKALGTEVIESVSPQQQFIKVVHDELIEILGGENVPIKLEGNPPVVMLLGLQGAGKTTACGKLAKKLKDEGMSPLLVACDVQRPAAILQLQTLGNQIDVPVFANLESKDVHEIAEQALAQARENKNSPVIIDTAGRLQIDTELMAEIMILDRAFEPSEKLLVIDAMTGQESVNVAETFNTQLDVSGIILTKVDGDARGGAALSVREVVGRPIKYISNGEKLDNLDAFYPDRMASRIFDMGDVVSLVEKAKQVIDEKEAEKVAMQMLKGDFTLEMFIKSQKMMKKMGNMGDLMKMMGIGGMFGINSADQAKIAEHGDKMMRLYETAINSMTLEEQRMPEIITMSRRRRIAAGAGLKDSEVGQMLNEFEQMRGMMSQFRKMMGGFGGGFPGMPGAGAGGSEGGGGSLSDLMAGLGGGARPGMPPMPGGMPGGLPPGFPGGLPGSMPKKKPPSGYPGGIGGGYYKKKKKK
ncbi:MAG: signal recognition particle protein [Candidatus Melainabacteria bacterium]|nr:signal recognition particle protein [Candidatus Melainabacteria bacterium]